MNECTRLTYPGLNGSLTQVSCTPGIQDSIVCLGSDQLVASPTRMIRIKIQICFLAILTVNLPVAFVVSVESSVLERLVPESVPRRCLPYALKQVVEVDESYS